MLCCKAADIHLAPCSRHRQRNTAMSARRLKNEGVETYKSCLKTSGVIMHAIVYEMPYPGRAPPRMKMGYGEVRSGVHGGPDRGRDCLVLRARF
jgi:hypothetical protein